MYEAMLYGVTARSMQKDSTANQINPQNIMSCSWYMQQILNAYIITMKTECKSY